MSKYPPYEERDDREAREVRADERSEQSIAYDEQREQREVRADQRASRDEDLHGEARERREVRAEERAVRNEKRDLEALVADSRRFHRDRRLWLAAFVVLVAFNFFLFNQISGNASEACQATEASRFALIEAFGSDIETAKVFRDTSASPEVRRYHQQERLPALREARSQVVVPGCE